MSLKNWNKHVVSQLNLNNKSLIISKKYKITNKTSVSYLNQTLNKVKLKLRILEQI